MYHIAQHVIHLTAGRPALDLYISNTPHKNDSDHPVGIFSDVLKEKLQGKASNYPHKIVYSMWEARQELISELKTYGIGLAAETQREGYKRLLCKSESWWNLLRMFKMSTLPGQSLHLPKAFGELDQSKQEGLLNAIKKKREGDQTSGIVNGQNSVGPTRPTKRHSRSPSLEIEHTAVPGTEMRVTRSLAAKRPCLTASNEEQLAPVLPDDEAGESDTSHTAEQGPNSSTSNIRRQIQHQLLGLMVAVSDIPIAEAEGLQHLLTEVQQLQGNRHAERVMHSMAERVPTMVRRAERSLQKSTEAEEEWEALE
ncbi:hypothetical protein RhiJN_08712 [Ceratobasidium sp. AG-Ba]|nr:hypothetical protein RhiJN_08712 [Ceratobasidium sp. AG-Ba]QRW09491.1 hypothetical protein RhiLY_08490 [Ceratobasidium sp. AG-Ba]